MLPHSLRGRRRPRRRRHGHHQICTPKATSTAGAAAAAAAAGTGTRRGVPEGTVVAAVATSTRAWLAPPCRKDNA